MFRPEMLRPMGLPEDVSVIAWGLSLVRAARGCCRQHRRTRRMVSRAPLLPCALCADRTLRPHTPPLFDVRAQERPTMILYGIDNIRDLFGHKVNLSMIKRNPICRLGL